MDANERELMKKESWAASGEFSDDTEVPWERKWTTRLPTKLPTKGERYSAGNKLGEEVLVGDVDVLQLGVAFHRGHAQISAEAAVLEATEGSFDVHTGVGIDAEDTALDAPGYA